MNVSHFCATTTLYKRRRSRAKQGYSSRSHGVIRVNRVNSRKLPFSHDQKTLSGTSMFHLAFDFSKNGIQSGLNGKQDNLLIDFTTKYQITNLQADVFVFYSCIVQHTGSETRIMS